MWQWMLKFNELDYNESDQHIFHFINIIHVEKINPLMPCYEYIIIIETIYTGKTRVAHELSTFT